MGRGRCAADMATTVDMLRLPSRSIGNCPVRLSELHIGDRSHRLPMADRGIEIEPFVEVQPDSQPGLVDLEERAKPLAEQAHERRIRVRELHDVPRLRPVAGVEAEAGHQELALGELTDAFDPRDPKAVDLRDLGPLELVGPRLRAPRLGFGTKSTSRTHLDTDDLATPSSLAMSSNVHDWARSSRARSCSATLPLLPMPQLPSRV